MNPKSKTSQGGSVLVEAMMAILIFSFGVLGVMGLQATMIVGSADAKYRNEASFYANRLLGEMWASDRSTNAALSVFATSGTRYERWYNEIKNTTTASGLLGLPGAAANPPTVVITPVNNPTSGFATSYDVTVSVLWQTPGKPVHRHTVVASITAD
jgi:type IV pilus assembly protein PilV